MIRRGLHVRDRGWEERFLDLEYVSLLERPLQVVRRVYEFWGASLSEEAEARMKAWLEQNRNQEQRQHDYSLERYGLNDQEVKVSFSSYLKRFNLEAPAVSTTAV
jgi:hypothetical protein